jgi:hypothetical protein
LPADSQAGAAHQRLNLGWALHPLACHPGEQEDVVGQAEASPRAQHPGNLPHGLWMVHPVMERDAAQDKVGAAVRKRERLNPADPLQAGVVSPGFSQTVGTKIARWSNPAADRDEKPTGLSLLDILHNEYKIKDIK